MMLALFSTAQTLPQDSTQVKQLYVLTKYNKQTYVGYILKDDGREVTIMTDILGELIIPKSELLSISKVEERSRISGGKYFPIMPFANRYGITGSALRNESLGQYVTVSLVGAEFRYHVSPRLSLGVTSSWILAPIVLNANYSFRKKPSLLNFSVSNMVGTGSYLGRFKSYIGVHLFTTTIGNQRHHLSLSAGYGYFQNSMRNPIYTPGEYSTYPNTERTARFSMQQGPVLCLSGKTEISPTFSFILESVYFTYNTETSSIRWGRVNASSVNGVYIPEHYSYLVTNYTKNMKVLLISTGYRFQLNSHAAFQFSVYGMGTKSTKTDFVAIPMVGFFFKV
jgi:hypothetical protein